MRLTSAHIRFNPALIVGLFLSVLVFAAIPLHVHAQNPINQTRRAFKKAVRPIINEKRRTERDVDRLNRMVSKNKRTFDSSTDTANIVVWNKQPFIPNKGMIKDYEYVYRFLHRKEAVYFDADALNQAEIVWDSTTNRFYKNVEIAPQKRDDFQLFGWLPYWMLDTVPYLRYDVLSRISYYAYEVNPQTGGLANTSLLSSLKQTAFMDSTAKHNVDTYLAVSLIGEQDLRTFLSSVNRQERLYGDILAVIDSLGFDGVELDFEQLPVDMKEAYTRFVRTFGAKLRQQAERIGRPQYLMVDVPFFDAEGSYDLSALNPFIDWVNILAYNFSGEAAAYPGSISPLRSGINQPNLETSVNDVLNQGVNTSKVMLSMPLFGDLWRVTDVEKGVPPVFENSLMYGDIQSTLDLDYYPTYDAYTASSFYMLDGLEEGERFMCWFESDQSFRVKMAWMQEKNLGGMGLWALGYDKGDAEFWDAMQEGFFQPQNPLQEIEPLYVERGALFGVMAHILEHQSVFGVAFLFFAAAIILGLVFSLSHWQVREKLFASAFFRYFNGLILFFLLLIGVFILFPIEQPIWVIIWSVLGGLAAFLLATLTFNLYRKHLQ
jgi:spore germination protein YaaH